MAKTVGDHLIERLLEWGVGTIYGYPGDGIAGIMGAMDRHTDRFRFVQTRHEELAAFMACAHGKFSGEVGVCLATSGPGSIHLLNGLYDAKLDHAPVLAIVGQQDSRSLGGSYQQEVDLGALFKDVAHEYVHTCMHPAQLRHLVDRAMRIAKARRTVTCIIVPNDVQDMDAVETPPHAHGTVHSGIGHALPRVLPHEEDLRAAAEVLNAGKRVAILAGAGALGAREELQQVAERLGAGVAKALLGRAVLSDRLPYCTGSIGLLGTRPSWTLMSECDTLLVVGSSFPYSEFLPEEGQARGVQIDIAPRNLSLRYPMEVNLVGDAQETLSALLPLLLEKQDRDWRQRLEEEIVAWWELMDEQALEPGSDGLINPQRVFREVDPRLPHDAILTCDSGSAANWWARHVHVEPSMLASLSGTLATMGPGVPYAVAAKFARPGRPVFAFVGDGAMQMNGINCLVTIEKYWRHWEDPRLLLCILNNQDLNQVTWEQRALAGDPEYKVTQELPPFDFAEYARARGLVGLRVEDAEDVAGAWDQALAADRPAVLDFRTDPSVPPLPPHIDWKKAKNFLKSMMKGDPHRWDVVRRSAQHLADAVLR